MVSFPKKIFHKKTLAIFTLCSWHDFLGGISLKWAPKENHNLIWQESIRYNLMLRAPHHENPIKININENIKHSKPNKTNSRNALRDPLFTFTYIAKKKQATTSSQRIFIRRFRTRFSENNWFHYVIFLGVGWFRFIFPNMIAKISARCCTHIYYKQKIYIESKIYIIFELFIYCRIKNFHYDLICKHINGYI